MYPRHWSKNGLTFILVSGAHVVIGTFLFLHVGIPVDARLIRFIGIPRRPTASIALQRISWSTNRIKAAKTHAGSTHQNEIIKSSRTRNQAESSPTGNKTSNRLTLETSERWNFPTTICQIHYQLIGILHNLETFMALCNNIYILLKKQLYLHRYST